MKRFYKLVSSAKETGGWSIQLDGKPVKTPMKATLLAPNQALADLIVQEWAAQEDIIDPETMPITQILSTQTDQVANQRAEMSVEILKYLDTDLLCYRAGVEPPGQADAQAQSWNPWLKWFEDKFGEKLKTTTDLVALRHDESAHKAAREFAEALDDAHFTVLQMLVPLSGSLVLAMAFTERAISPQELFDATHVEEHFKDKIYNAELYGRDPLQEQKDEVMMRDLKAAEVFLKNL
ncbi:MAG: ATP12 family protein [Pseudomonadota bacterium]